MMQDWLHRYLTRTTALYDRLVRYSFYAAGVLIMTLALSIGMNVIMRRLFQKPIGWIVEGGEYILLFVTFLAAAHILHENGHARMTLLVERLRPRRARLLNLFSAILGAAISLTLAWVTGTPQSSPFSLATSIVVRLRCLRRLYGGLSRLAFCSSPLSSCGRSLALREPPHVAIRGLGVSRDAG